MHMTGLVGYRINVLSMEAWACKWDWSLNGLRCPVAIEQKGIFFWVA